MAGARRARGNAASHMLAWRLELHGFLPGVPFCDGLSEESSVSAVLFVKESFWPAEFRLGPSTHEYNEIAGMARLGSGFRNLPIRTTSAVAQSSGHRDNPG